MKSTRTCGGIGQKKKKKILFSLFIETLVMKFGCVLEDIWRFMLLAFCSRMTYCFFSQNEYPRLFVVLQQLVFHFQRVAATKISSRPQLNNWLLQHLESLSSFVPVA